MNERETPRKPPRTPPGLGPRGRRIWGETVQNFDLRADESALLLELCRSYDRLDVLEAAVVKAPLLLDGSKNQARPHPLLGEVRQYRLAIVNLTRALALSDVPDAGDDGKPLPTPKQARARHAAQARWGHRGA